MNATKIVWTKKAVSEQIKRNAERTKKLQRNDPPKIIKRIVRPSYYQRTRVGLFNPGYIYCIRVGSRYKIGLTDNFSRRITDLKRQYRFSDYDLLALISTEDMIGLEIVLHDRFEATRITGEWFALDAKDIAYIQSLV